MEVRKKNRSPVLRDETRHGVGWAVVERVLWCISLISGESERFRKCSSEYSSTPVMQGVGGTEDARLRNTTDLDWHRTPQHQLPVATTLQQHRPHRPSGASWATEPARNQENKEKPSQLGI